MAKLKEMVVGMREIRVGVHVNGTPKLLHPRCPYGAEWLVSRVYNIPADLPIS